MSDLFRVHSVKILGHNREVNHISSVNQTKRRLYWNDDDNDGSVMDPNRFHFESAIEIILDMLDDEVRQSFSQFTSYYASHLKTLNSRNLFPVILFCLSTLL